MVRCLLLLALLVPTAGCSRCTPRGTPRPTCLAEWEACWIAAHRLAPSKARPAEIVRGKGSRAVLFLHVRWGESLIRTEYQYGEVMVELPALAKAGAQARLEDPARALYVEGGQGGFEKQGLTGTVELLGSDGDHVELKLDLRTASGPPTRVWRATIHAARVPDLRTCLRR
jgi:hypothetical protein